MKTELEQIEKMVPAKLFKAKAIGTLLKAIEIEATALIPDVETLDGREAIKSLAYKVARSKTTIDDIGKKYVADQKAAIAVIDGVRKVARDFLDQLKVTVRAPLTAWENDEVDRINKIQDKIEIIKDLGALTDDDGVNIPAATLDARIEKLRYMKITKIYGEYQDEAINAKNAAIVQLTEAVPAQEEREYDARNNLLQAEQEVEEKRIEEEQRIAREAVEAADLESTRELEEIQRKAAHETAEQAKRERDTRHKAKVHREAAAGIQKVLEHITDDDAKKLVRAMVKKQIPYIHIYY
jgi:hypothetical protein